jgi:hypothetical protein
LKVINSSLQFNEMHVIISNAVQFQHQFKYQFKPKCKYQRIRQQNHARTMTTFNVNEEVRTDTFIRTPNGKLLRTETQRRNKIGRRNSRHNAWQKENSKVLEAILALETRPLINS